MVVLFLGIVGLLLPLGVLPPPQAIPSVPILQPNVGGTSLTAWADRQSPLSLPLVTSSSAHGQGVPVIQPHSGMILSPSADLIQYCLVHKIQGGEFVEMWEFLADNITLHDQTTELHGQVSLAVTPVGLCPQAREVLFLTSWMYYFSAYMDVRTRNLLTRDLLAYTCLIIRKALCHGGDRWQQYVRFFCRQVAMIVHYPGTPFHPVFRP